MAVFQITKTVTKTIVYEVEASDADAIYECRDDWEIPENIIDSEIIYAEIDDIVRVNE